MAQLYNDSINEFINWISGYDILTNRQSITQGISGKSVRELIESHLRKPFYVFEDTDNNRKLLFSSRDAYNRWNNAVTNNNGDEETIANKYKDLVLLDFATPAPHTIYIIGENGSPLSTINLVDDGTTTGEIAFRYYIDSIGGPTSGADITLNVIDPNTKLTKVTINRHQEPQFSNGETVSRFFVGEYLSTGENRIEIQIKLTDNISAEPLKTTLVVNMIKFNIELLYQGNKTFNKPYNYDVSLGGYESLNFKINCFKSIEETVKLNLSIEVNGQEIKTLDEGNWKTTSLSKNLTLNNVYQGSSWDTVENITNNVQNTLVIKSHMYNESGTISFYGNTIHCNFENQAYDTSIHEKQEIANAFINLYYSTTNYTTSGSPYGYGLVLTGSQYNPFTLRWGYYTDGPYLTVNVKWVLRKYNANHDSVESETYLATIQGISGQESEELTFIPDIFFKEQDNYYLCALIINQNTSIEECVFETPFAVLESKFEIVFQEYPGAALKLNAFGRTNSESLTFRNKWEYGEYRATFSEDFPFDLNNGWNNNTLNLSDETCYVTINFNPFSHDGNNDMATYGRAIEIDFKSTNVANESHKLAIFGDDTSNGAYIVIYPSKAVLYKGSNEILTTNFKSNERIQLMFIFMSKANSSDPNAGNIYIVNNGILERGVGGQDYTSMMNNNSGNIKLGGSNSGIQIYNIRVWWNNLSGGKDSIYDAFLNYLFDCNNKGTIISRNAITKSGSDEPDYTACTNKIDTFLIEGDLSTILNAGASKNESETAVNITYSNPNNKTLGFTALNVKLRKHGQSTLNYPITSFKMWLNKSKGENLSPTVRFSDIYSSKEYVKNRYTIKSGSIPSNKFVLQANYADSSGVHNGGILRLINDTWYNANFGTNDNPIYRLRTAPQLFASGQTVVHNDENLHEVEYDKTDPSNPILVTDHSWIDGYGNTNKTFGGLTAIDHTWPQLLHAFNPLVEQDKLQFPYKLRIAPDSLPCVVFYKNTLNLAEGEKYLGQFVFMDDKKSDHIYGERSIYLWGDGSDPFCMTNEGANTVVTNNSGEKKKGYDRDANCVWDNKNVLRIEVVLVNTTLTSFMNFNVSDTIEYYTTEEITAASNAYITDGVENMTSVEQEAWIAAHPAYGKAAGDPKGSGDGSHPANEIKYITDNGIRVPSKYYWEDYFEMIFPDEEDIEEDDASKGLTKFDQESKFVKKAQPWIRFLSWICSVGQLNKDNFGNYIIDGNVSEAALNKFKSEAAQYLDLYKVAAYYIFYIRFGLVDSVERNAQLKTYDGVHWFYEPWDMDIALGNKNTGGLVYDPPLTRDSRMPGSPNIWAYSGRSTATSNVLWDCLEAWDYWMNTVVPKTAEALYKAGLNYDNITNMFDEEYANKWSEILYNNSGLYKYVTAAQDKNWLGWLQGSRTSHRHWWVSTSMNFYDSKWTCGAFNSSRLYLAVNKTLGEAVTISLTPTTETYFKMTQKDGESAIDETINGGLKLANPVSPATFDLTNYAFSAKDPTHIFGVLFLEKLDLGKFANGIEKMIFQNAVDPILGATIKELNIGCTMVEHQGESYYDGWVNGGDISISNTSSINTTDNDLNATDALENIETFNATGQLKITDANIITDNRIKLKNIYAAGTSFSGLTSSKQGNKFNIVQLPAHNITNDTHITKIYGTSLNLVNTTWNEISFWDCRYNENVGEPIQLVDEHGELVWETDEHGEYVYDDNEQRIPVYINKEQDATFEELQYIHPEFQSVTFTGSTSQNPCSIIFIKRWFDSIEHQVAEANPSLTGNDLEEAVLAVIKTKNATIKDIRWNYGIDPSSANYVNLTYKDMVRLGNLNGGYNEERQISNNTGSNFFTGYVKIGGSNMQTWEMANLMKLFGDNVFDINSISNNLVIDQASTYAQITVSGATAIGQDIYINEGQTVNLKCTQFLLTTELAQDYTWEVYSNSTFSANSADEMGAGGVYKVLRLSESANTSVYTITVKAEHKTSHTIATLNIKVNPAQVSRRWSFEFLRPDNNWTVPRQFTCDSTVAESLFGNYYTTTYNNSEQVAPIYILDRPSLLCELALKSDETYTAQVKEIKFELRSISGNNFVVNNAIPILSGDTLADENFTLNYNICTEYNLLDIEGGASGLEGHYDPHKPQTIHNSIKFRTKGDFAAKASNMLLFSVGATVYYQSTAIIEQTYTCNFIIYDDSNAITDSTRKSGVSLINKLRTDYPNSAFQTAQVLYKSDLVSIKGSLVIDGGQENNIDTVASRVNNADSIFNYMPNVQSISFTNTTWTNGNNGNIPDGKIFDFTKLKSLQTLNLNGIGSGASFTVDTTGSITIETVNLKTTNCSIHAENNPNLTTLKLGSPFDVYINNCPLLSNSDFECESSARIDTTIGGRGGSITIINNSNINTYAYKVFDKIYNPVTS